MLYDFWEVTSHFSVIFSFCTNEGVGLEISNVLGLQWLHTVAQWLRIRLPMQGTRVRALVWEDAAEQLSTCATTTEPAL